MGNFVTKNSIFLNTVKREMGSGHMMQKTNFILSEKREDNFNIILNGTFEN